MEKAVPEIKPVLKKVVMEFDTYIQALEGNAAQEWLKSINDMVMMAYIHGQSFPYFEWQKENIDG